MTQTEVAIEKARPEDAEIICDIRDRAWIEAYPNPDLGITAEDIKLNAQGKDGVFVPRRIAYMKSQFAKNSHTDLTTYVAKINGKVVGYTEPRIYENGKRYVSAIYVAPEMQGVGVGGKLLRKALSVLGNDKDIFLEVISYNQKAIGFYEHFGFVKTDAAVPEEVGRPDYMKTLPEIEMVLRAE